MYNTRIHRIREKGRNSDCSSDEALLFEILVRLTIVNVAFFVLELFHGLLFEYLVATLALELFGHCIAKIN